MQPVLVARCAAAVGGAHGALGGWTLSQGALSCHPLAQQRARGALAQTGQHQLEPSVSLCCE